MWAAIAAVISIILGFGTGMAVTKNQPGQPSPTATIPIGFRACYNPQPNIKLTLKWPEHFTSVPDYRPSLNPEIFGSFPTEFSSTNDGNNDGFPDCKVMVMDSKTSDLSYPKVERTFILVRRDVRMASCKTDEHAGPYAGSKCTDPPNYPRVEDQHRGSCSIEGYPEIRKIAQIEEEGETKEIFWNPFSYNVGCNWEKNNNCGPRDSNFVNLKDFIYVVKKRDAFTPQDKPGCPAFWDAGSTNAEACSHFFDIYMAEDLYQKIQTMPNTTDVSHPNYFYKQVMENCQEQNFFTPAPDSLVSIPPSFISIPFILPENANLGLSGKINPANKTESDNYNFYVWERSTIINPETTNLLLTTKTSSAVSVCSSSASSPIGSSNCYNPIGSIIFTDEKGQDFSYRVFSQKIAPQTFSLVDPNTPNEVYVYTITEKQFPTNSRRDPSLQLRSLEMIAQNEWTWATPLCKPAIYLYPETPTDLTVKLNIEGKITVSNPPYDEEKGWDVRANPDGTIHNNLSSLASNQGSISPMPWIPDHFDRLSARQVRDDKINGWNDKISGNDNGTFYPYLYYEADVSGIEIPKEGWVVEKSNVNPPAGGQISKLMTEIGFNEKEIADFLAYWLPRLQDKPYYFVTILPEEIINEKEKLEFSKNPDTLIRVRFVFEGLDAPISVNPLTNVPHYQRVGFTVTDWGGTIVGKSCQEVNVK